MYTVMVYCCFSLGASKANYEFAYKFILFSDPTIFGHKSNMLSLDFPFLCCTPCSAKLSTQLFLMWFISFSWSCFCSHSHSFPHSHSLHPSPPSASLFYSFFFHRNVSSTEIYILKISRTQILLHNFHLLVANYAKIKWLEINHPRKNLLPDIFVKWISNISTMGRSSLYVREIDPIQ